MFDKDTLEEDLETLFFGMRDGTVEGDSAFAEGIADAVKAFGESGEVETTDSGTVSSGYFSGAGTGSLTLTSSLMSSPIITACGNMRIGEGSNNMLAEAIGEGILAMTSEADIVSTDVEGTTTSQGSTVPPYSGTAKGTITCDNTDLIQGLKDTFTAMGRRAHSQGFDGDEYFAKELADLVYDYFTAGTIETHGEGDLSGTTGTGSIS